MYSSAVVTVFVFLGLFICRIHNNMTETTGMIEGYKKPHIYVDSFEEFEQIADYLKRGMTNFYGQRIVLDWSFDSDNRLWKDTGKIAFEGTLDGRGCSIRGRAPKGVFSTVGKNGKIQNVAFENGNAKSFLVGDNHGTVQNCTISGGFLVRRNKGVIQNCLNYSERVKHNGFAKTHLENGMAQECYLRQDETKAKHIFHPSEENCYLFTSPFGVLQNPHPRFHTEEVLFALSDWVAEHRTKGESVMSWEGVMPWGILSGRKNHYPILSFWEFGEFVVSYEPGHFFIIQTDRTEFWIGTKMYDDSVKIARFLETVAAYDRGRAIIIKWCRGAPRQRMGDALGMCQLSGLTNVFVFAASEDWNKHQNE